MYSVIIASTGSQGSDYPALLSHESIDVEGSIKKRFLDPLYIACMHVAHHGAITTQFSQTDSGHLSMYAR